MLEILSIAVLGWLAGVVVNYISDILPHKRRFVTPFCPNCSTQYSFINYVLWPRKCLACDKRRSLRVWLVELIYIAVTLLLWQFPPPSLNFGIGYLLLVYFGIVTIIDLEHRLIMHPVSLVGVVLGIGVGFWMHGIIPTIIGGAVGFLVMFALYYLGILFIRFRSKNDETLEIGDALGFGDVNLSAVLGLMLGWPGIMAGLLLAIILAGVVSLFYILVMISMRRYQSNLAIAYGPFLIASGVMLLFLRPYLFG